MNPTFVNIHTHRPTGRGIELRIAGIHPWEAEKQPTEMAIQTLEAALNRGGEQAIGEIGLDYARATDNDTRNAQIALFDAQLSLARQRQLPVILHCVRAFEPTMQRLAKQEPRDVIFHGFIGSPEQARRAIARGYYLSFGERSFASHRTVEALRTTPLPHLFFETDDSPTPIDAIYMRAAELSGFDLGTLKRATTENYQRIFSGQDE